MTTPPAKKIRILLADDHLIVRMGLSAIISSEKDLELVGEASNGEEVVKLTGRVKPDVIIMDLMMPKLNGAEATAQVLKMHPQVKVLILTTFGESESVAQALNAGAAGAMVKDTNKATLLGAIRRVFAGERIISPEIQNALSAAEPPCQLSPRHVEILSYVAKGLNNREIAQIIGIGPDCVKAHLRTAFSLLNAATRAEAVSIALSKNLLKI